MRAQDFLVGAKDFFSILVPGAVLLLLVRVELSSLPYAQNEALTVFAFAIAAYVAGSVASGLGAGLDLFVDEVIDRDSFRNDPHTTLGKRYAFALDMRERIEARQSRKSPERHKGFWRDYVRLNCPVGASELERLEANQKLFRSLAAVCAILLLAKLAAYLAPFWMRDPTLSWVSTWLLSTLLLVSLILYAAGRLMFLAAVYRLAVACMVCREPAGSR